jgi:prepilin-type N-terminal cleavage/methylation domain-containing protein
VNRRLNCILAARNADGGRGFTLTELAIVLGIVSVILTAIWVAAGAVYNNIHVARSNQQILQISQAVQSLYKATLTTGVTDGTQLTGPLIAAGVFPADALPGGPASTLVNSAWPNGVMNVYSASTAGGPLTGDAFIVQFENIPAQGCINLLVSNSGIGRDPGLQGAGAASYAGTSCTSGGTVASPLNCGTVISAMVVSATAGSLYTLGPNSSGVSVSQALTMCGSTDDTIVAFKFVLTL